MIPTCGFNRTAARCVYEAPYAQFQDSRGEWKPICPGHLAYTRAPVRKRPTPRTLMEVQVSDTGIVMLPESVVYAFGLHVIRRLNARN